MMRTQPSLSRDFLVLSLTIVLILGLVLIWIAHQTVEDYTEKTTSLLEFEAVRIDRTLITEIKNASYLLQSLGRQIGQYGPENLSHISRLLRAFNSEGQTSENGYARSDVISWIDDSQRVIVSSNLGILRKPEDVSDRDYVKKTLVAAPWSVQIGRPIFGRVSKKWILPVSMGVTDFTGKHLGIILVSVDIAALTREMQREIRKKSIRFAILSQTLIPLTESDAETTDTAQRNLPIEKLANIDFAKEPSGLISKPRLFYGGEQDFVHYEVSSKYPYIIVIGYDSELSLKEVRRLLLPRLAQLGIIAVFLITLLWMVRTRVIRPVEALSGIAAAIARGDGYTPLKHGPLELEQLAEQIQKIDQFLKERGKVEEELLLKNNYLKRVKETAQAVSRARAQFLESLARELDKPAESIRESAEAMKDQHFGPMQHDTYLKLAHDVYRLSTELKHMIVDIGHVSELEQGVLILYDKPVNITFALHRAIRQFHEAPQYRHLEIKLRADEALPKLVVDEERFNQILVNLFTGAAQQLSPGSAMVCEAVVEKNEHGEEEYLFMLKYSLLAGHGGAGSDLPRARYFPANGKEAGSPVFIQSEGINLALTRMLVSLHQGAMESQVSSNHVCRIYIRFPAKRIQQQKRRKPAQNKPQSVELPQEY